MNRFLVNALVSNFLRILVSNSMALFRRITKLIISDIWDPKIIENTALLLLVFTRLDAESETPYKFINNNFTAKLNLD